MLTQNWREENSKEDGIAMSSPAKKAGNSVKFERCPQRGGLVGEQDMGQELDCQGRRGEVPERAGGRGRESQVRTDNFISKQS